MEKPQLLQKHKLSSLVENKTSFNLNNCEFNIYETHQSAFGVKLHFDHLAFTGMLRGKKMLKLEDKTDYFQYLPGESILVAPGETMVIDFPEADEQPSQCISLSLNPDFVENSLTLLNLHHSKVDDSTSWNISASEFYLFNTPALASATTNIMRIAMDDNSHKDIMADFALKELLIRLMQTQARKMLEINKPQAKSRISFIADYIRKNLHNKISVEKIAEMAYVSKSNFFRMFKQELGLTPNEFILQERILKAKQLLLNHENIKEVAYSTGFSDTNYFTRVFKQTEGITPKTFQLLNKNY